MGLIVLGLAFASVGRAEPGVIEINQAAALQGGVTPGDPPGFPVLLLRSGSYRLTGNLDAPLADGAVLIIAPDVSLDLGGFAVTSTNVCTGSPTNTSCAATTGAPGIRGSEPTNIVRNGFVRGFGGSCVFLDGPSAQIDQVIASGCGQDGIFAAGLASRVIRSSALQNRDRGIVIGHGALAESNESRGNGGHGLFVTGPRLVSQVVANRLYDNAGLGITGNAAFQPIVTRNFLSNNTIGPYALVVSLGDNLCVHASC